MNQLDEINQVQSKNINLWPYIILASIIFIAFIVIGFMIPLEMTKDMIQDLNNTLQMLKNLGPVSLLILIFVNNAIKCLLAILLGILIGLPPAIFICFNAVSIGILASALGPQLGYTTVVLSLLPHGIIEIPALVVSTALGLSIGAEAWKFIIKQKSSVRKQLGYSLTFYGRWLLLALLVAAIIEVFITPLVISSSGAIPPI
jgi:stage II sporulation protein M